MDKVQKFYLWFVGLNLVAICFLAFFHLGYFTVIPIFLLLAIGIQSKSEPEVILVKEVKDEGIPSD